MVGHVSLKVSIQWLYENEPALESDLDVVAFVEVINPDGIPGSGDERFRTLSSGGRSWCSAPPTRERTSSTPSSRLRLSSSSRRHRRPRRNPGALLRSFTVASNALRQALRRRAPSNIDPPVVQHSVESGWGRH
jgi:hypothetical protein